MALRKLDTRVLLQLHKQAKLSQTKFLTTGPQYNRWRKALYVAGGVLTASGLGVCYALENSVKAADLMLHPAKYQWPHNGLIASLDIASVRRGYEVYKNVCAACHSLKYVSYRELVNTVMTEEEAKREAEEIQVQDGPDEQGKMFMRPGKLSDHFPNPYPNEEAARAANNGAFPPDLSYITLARHGGEDYVFSLLTGYMDPPAGIKIQEGQHFNPYFLGGAIGMARSLFNETIEYSDGTPATASQMAKDVCSFLVWTGQPEHDERKLMLIKVVFIGTLMTISCLIWKRHVWASLKSRKIMYAPRK